MARGCLATTRKPGAFLEAITASSLWELVRHLKRWLVNLHRAGHARKAQSIRALRAVILASRLTSVYLRQLNDTGQQSHTTEGQLSEEWTRLGFELQDLGLTSLAKRCEIKGRYWANPQQFSHISLHFCSKQESDLVIAEPLE